MGGSKNTKALGEIQGGGNETINVSGKQYQIALTPREEQRITSLRNKVKDFEDNELKAMYREERAKHDMIAEEYNVSNPTNELQKGQKERTRHNAFYQLNRVKILLDELEKRGLRTGNTKLPMKWE
ncbi:MAG: hypothetical protein IJS60_08895 [Abditibacteriota bacterium]|nr:hypothetical protein [Abditibacteriota bacterium]